MTETKRINNYNSSKTANYEELKKRAYTETKTYKTNEGTYKEIESTDAKSKYYSEDDENIILMQFNSSTRTGTLCVADKASKQYVKITDVKPDSISSDSSSKRVMTDAWSGYYKIGASNYPAEGFLYTYTTTTGYNVKMAEIYCYNGKSWPDYIVSEVEQPDYNGDGSMVMKETRCEKVDFKTSADANLMNFDKVLNGYDCVATMTYDDYLKHFGGSTASYSLKTMGKAVR